MDKACMMCGVIGNQDSEGFTCECGEWYCEECEEAYELCFCGQQLERCCLCGRQVECFGCSGCCDRQFCQKCIDIHFDDDGFYKECNECDGRTVRTMSKCPHCGREINTDEYISVNEAERITAKIKEAK